MSQKVLRKGARGKSVAQLQSLLNGFNKDTALTVDTETGINTAGDAFKSESASPIPSFSALSNCSKA